MKEEFKNCKSKLFTPKWQNASETKELHCASGLFFDPALVGLTSHPAPCQESKLAVKNSLNRPNIPPS